MKRILLMVVCIAVFGGALSSCSKEGGNDSSKNPLVGTLWEEDDDAPWRMEFVDATTVSVWGGYNNPDTGTYRVEGNTVYFTDLESVNYYTYKYISATFTNNTMKVAYTISCFPDEIRYRYLYKK